MQLKPIRFKKTMDMAMKCTLKTVQFESGHEKMIRVVNDCSNTGTFIF